MHEVNLILLVKTFLLYPFLSLFFICHILYQHSRLAFSVLPYWVLVRTNSYFHSFDACTESFNVILQSWMAAYFDCRPFIKVPVTVVRYVLLLFKWMHGKLGFRKYNHSVSAYYIQLASHTRTFNCTAAQKHIGYSPVVPLEVSSIFSFTFFHVFPFAFIYLYHL